MAFATEDMFGSCSWSSLPACVGPATGDPPGHQDKQHLVGRNAGQSYRKSGRVQLKVSCLEVISGRWNIDESLPQDQVYLTPLVCASESLVSIASRYVSRFVG